ncbi:hypothetical protein HC864_00735 [Candidatus Gracilibacteria bacterium]|nr:hypothetical protein [Candidatus Gracilibacteria bacterium]
MNKQIFNYFVTENFLPLFFLLNYSLLAIIWQIFSLPASSIILDFIFNQFNKYGLIILPLSSFIESISIFTSYFPGSTIIVFSFLSANYNLGKIILFYILFSLGFILGYVVDYFLGRFAINYIQKKLNPKERFQKQERFQKKYGILAHFLSLSSPTIGGFYSVFLGNKKQNFSKFIFQTIIGVLFWCLIWSSISLIFGPIIINDVSKPNSIFGILITWLLISIILNNKNPTSKGGDQYDPIIYTKTN